MNRFSSLISIITSTYNRSRSLHFLYESLVKCENTDDIEWIIIDDGSTDDTKDVVNGFIIEKKIPIKYYYQENQGKHVAINESLKHVVGDYCFIIDSDDRMADGALESAKKWLNGMPKDFAGIGGQRIKPNGDLIGATFKGDYLDCSTLERKKNNILGDKAEIFRTSLLKQYKFPVIQGENFIPEAIVWNRIANDGYKIRWINEPFIICEYREDGLTKNRVKILEQNYNGYLLYLKELIQYERDVLERKKHMLSYYEIAKKHFSDKYIMKELGIGKMTLSSLKPLTILKRIMK